MTLITTPWKVQQQKPFNYPSPSGNRPDHCIVGTGEGTLDSPFHHIADCGIAESDECQANAALIAAAPELLDGCMAALAYLAPPVSKFPENIDAAVKIIRAAVNKAKQEPATAN